MGLIASEKGKVELIEEGLYIARCIAVIDLGTQLVKSKQFGDKLKHQARIDFELPTEVYTYEDKDTGEEMTNTKIIWMRQTISLASNWNLKPLLESWRWKKFTKEELAWFDLKNILNKECQLQITHSDDWQYANISNLMPLMKGTLVPKGLRTPMIFEINEDWYNQEDFNSLPEFIQKIIMESVEVRKLLWIETFEEQEKNMKKEAKQTITTQEAEEVFTEAKSPNEFE